jgi:SAM-dependent methyltransferase
MLLDADVGYVDGVEPEPDMAAVAMDVGYRHVWVSDVADLPDDLGQRYDAVVFYDVLEHLEDPWRILRKAHGWLKPGAQIALSVPNVCFWSVRRDVVLGRFDYQRFGILDRTHLRFFTQATLDDAVRQAGFAPVMVRVTGAPLPVLRSRRLGDLAARSYPALFGVQFVWLCAREDGRQ